VAESKMCLYDAACRYGASGTGRSINAKTRLLPTVVKAIAGRYRLLAPPEYNPARPARYLHSEVRLEAVCRN